MKQEPLFSVIILHYNQEHFLDTALNSLFIQKYSNIQLVFADDTSTELDVKRLKKYVEENKTKNIKEVIYQINNTNSGTVKNINNALDKCKGEYILFFAADDALYDENVLLNFKKEFDSLPTTEMVVTAQCYMYDKYLNEIFNKFVNASEATKLNSVSSFEQFKKIIMGCYYAMGATAFKKELFKKLGKFNERYKIIEDWAYQLYITRNNVKINFANFVALQHRDGGVSHYVGKKLPPHVIAYKNDLLSIFEYEILPYLKNLPLNDQLELIRNYFFGMKELNKIDCSFKRLNKVKVILNNKKLFLVWFMNKTVSVAKNRVKPLIKLSTILFGLWLLIPLRSGNDLPFSKVINTKLYSGVYIIIDILLILSIVTAFAAISILLLNKIRIVIKKIRRNKNV